jgi:UDP-galactopyranose mutase
VLASVDGQLVPIPINLDTVNRLYGMTLSAFEVDAFFESAMQRRSRTSNIGRRGGRPRRPRSVQQVLPRLHAQAVGTRSVELDASVTARVPMRTNRDDRYFTDTYQAMPLGRLHAHVRERCCRIRTSR